MTAPKFRDAAIVPAMIGVVVLAFAQRMHVPGAADVAWYLTVVEKWFDGARLYVDVVDNNPPFSIWLYAPFVAAARLLNARVERVLDVGLVALCLASLWCARRVARQEPRPRWSDVVALAALLILPAAAFAQREHFALAFAIPTIAAAGRRATGGAPPGRWVLATGLASGLALCVKPHFGLAIFAAYAVSAAAQRSPRPLFAPENWIAGFVFAIYAAAAFMLYPAYREEMLPLAALIYVPVRVTIGQMLFGWGPMLLTTAIIMFAAIWRTGAMPRHGCAMAAIAGFVAAALVQGKGWPYHFLPAFGLAAAVAGDAVLDFSRERPESGRLIAGAATAAFATVAWLCLGTGMDMRFMRDAVVAAKANPRMMTIGSDLGIGFPLVRDIDGVWVGRSVSLWIADYSRTMASRDPAPERLTRYRAIEESDRRRLAEDIRAGKPELILANRRPENWLGWARRDAEISDLLACYRSGGVHGLGSREDGAPGYEFEIEILVRGDCDR